MANTITIGDFNSQKENFTVIDVREPDEMAGGKIDGSKNATRSSNTKRQKRSDGRIKRKKNLRILDTAVTFQIYVMILYRQ